VELEGVALPGELDAGSEAEEPPELTGAEALAGGAVVVALAPATGVVTATLADVPPEGVDEAPTPTPATGVLVDTFADVPPEGVDETPTLAPATGVLAETFATVPAGGFDETPTVAVPPLLPVPVDTFTVVPVGSVAETLAAGTTTGSGTVTLTRDLEVEPELELNSEPAAQAGGAINRAEQATARAAAPRVTRSIQRPLSTYPITRC
jgi:hypothetical protein